MHGKVVVVTGSALGIGKAIATKFAQEGAFVVINSRHGKDIKKTVDELKEYTDCIFGVKADVSNEKDAKYLISQAVKRFGNIDILINNAAVAVHENFVKHTKDEINDIIDVNVKGIMYCTKAVLPKMLKRKSGVIVNISSGAGRTGYAGLSVYCASKFAICGFTESLGGELHKKGVKVYCLNPHATNTRMFHGLFPGTDPKTLDTPEHVADQVFKLTLPSCRKPNGAVVDVDERI